MKEQYELRLTTGKVVTWEGETGEGAARNYVDCHRDAAVIAWRRAERTGLFFPPSRRLSMHIIEPGHYLFGKPAKES